MTQVATWTLNGLTFGTSDAHGVDWYLTSDAGWYQPPEPRLSLSDRVLGHGSVRGRAYYGARVITLDGHLEAPDRAGADAALRRLAAVCADGELHELVVADGVSTLTAMVEPATRIDVERYTSRRAAWQVQLVAPDPRRYTVDTATVTVPAPDGGGGLTYPLTYPLSYGAAGDSGDREITHLGTVETPPVVTIAGPCEGPRLYNMTTGRQLHFDIALAAGDQLVVDTATEVVHLGGADRLHTIAPDSALPADWMIGPGATDLSYRPEAGTGSATVTIRHAYL